MTDFPEVRRLLDVVPVPPLPPVDVAAIFADALDAEARAARRWKRIAVAAAALAAGVLAFALGVSIGRRDEPTPVAVHPEPKPDPRVTELIDEQRKFLTALREANAQHAELQGLLLTLARDVNTRDDARKEQLAALADRLREFEAVTARQFQESERTNTALYHVVFPSKPSPTPKGDQP